MEGVPHDVVVTLVIHHQVQAGAEAPVVLHR
jgi:hypothetical protein